MDADDTEAAQRRKPGRPKGSRNKPRDGYRSPFEPVVIPPHRADRVIDPLRLVDDQLRLLSWTQELITEDMRKAVDGKHNASPGGTDVRKLADLSAAIAKVLDAMRRSHELADELAKRLSPEQLLELAIVKIEGQGIKTINYAIRRLRAYREKIAPVTNADMLHIGVTAADALESLEAEDS